MDWQSSIFRSRLCTFAPSCIRLEGTRSESSRVQKFLGAIVPGSISSRDGLGSEKSSSHLTLTLSLTLLTLTLKIRALVKNRTSHGSLGSRQTTHTCDTSLETSKCRLYTIRYTPTDWKVVNTLSYTVFNIYIMAHLLCAEEYWLSGLRLWNAEVHLNQPVLTCTAPVLKIMDAGYCLYVHIVTKNIKSLKTCTFNNSNQLMPDLRFQQCRHDN